MMMSKDIRSALTENLNELMRIKGIKAVDLAEKVGVSKSAVSHFVLSSVFIINNTVIIYNLSFSMWVACATPCCVSLCSIFNCLR